MPARVLKAAEEEGEFRMVIHLDVSRTITLEGETFPDPAWCFERTYPAQADYGRPVAETLMAAQAALKERLLSVGLSVPHPIEGKMLELLALTGTGLETPDSTGDRTAAGMPGKEE